jgi:hypothetical protein
VKISSLNLLSGKRVVPAKPSTASRNSLTQSSGATQKATPQVLRAKPAGVDPIRRGQRVLLRVHASVHVAMQGKLTTLHVATLSVNPLGAIVVMKDSLPAETRVVLEHGGTKQRVACRVARSPRQMPEGFHVPLEFDSPSPGFWKISFPSTDWRPEDS